MPPAIGMVRIHAHTILFTTPHLMALNRLAVPTPMIAEEMLWVVETGIPRADAPRITDAALVSAAKPWIGCNFTSLWPSVLMMRQPPAAVPAAITSAQVILIHRSIPPSFRASSEGCRKPRNPGRLSSVPAASALIRVRATMPMVFWASFMPCAKPMLAADTIWLLPKNPLTQRGRTMRANTPPARANMAMMKNSTPIIRKPALKPSTGEPTIGMITFHSTPALRHTGSAGSDQITTSKSIPAAASAAPIRPPISACEEEDGSPNHQVIRFQMIPPSSAHRISCEPTSTTPASMMPEAMVWATAVPASAPSRFMTAAMPTACIGESTLVATTVAMEFAVSWKPLMYSNTSAVNTTTSTRVSIGAPSGVLQHDFIGDHAGLAAAVDRLFQDFEEFLEQEHLQRLVLARVDVAVDLEHQPVGLVLDRAQFVVEGLHRLKLHLRQQPHHLHHHPGGLLEHGRARGKVDVLQVLHRQRIAVGELLDLLGDPVQRRAQGLDVLALHRGDEAVHQLLADLVGGLAGAQAGQAERVQGRLAVGIAHQLVQRLGRVVGRLGSLFEQGVELHAAAKNGLQ